jgi:hypothetical protein
MDGFSLSIKTPSRDVAVEGPIPLGLTITYEGKDEVTVLGDEFIEVGFEPPQGWALKERPALRHLQGWLPTVTLKGGESLPLTVYLHDYFSSIAPGKVELPVTVKIWRKTEGQGEAVALREVCELDVSGPDPGRFAERIAEIGREIASEQSAERRLALYKSVASLSHPGLIAIFLGSLLDPAMLVFHSAARRRLVELAETYGKRGLIIEHLANHGGRYDGEFFALWRQQQVSLSDEEVARLCESSSLWVRLFCLEQYQQQYNRKGLIESLKAELGELTERVGNLKNAQ